MLEKQQNFRLFYEGDFVGLKEASTWKTLVPALYERVEVYTYPDLSYFVIIAMTNGKCDDIYKVDKKSKKTTSIWHTRFAGWQFVEPCYVESIVGKFFADGAEAHDRLKVVDFYDCNKEVTRQGLISRDTEEIVLPCEYVNIEVYQMSFNTRRWVVLAKKPDFSYDALKLDYCYFGINIVSSLKLPASPYAWEYCPGSRRFYNGENGGRIVNF